MWKVTAHNIQLCPCCLDIKLLEADSKVAKLFELFLPRQKLFSNWNINVPMFLCKL